MYADDLLLVSGSVTDLQAMINICMTELNNPDLTVNAKNMYMLIGKNCKASCSNVSTESISIPWSNRISYLGITIQSSFKFIVDLKECRATFYRSFFNCLYSKIDLANKYMIVSLIKSFCTPVIMHSLCVLNLNASILIGVDNLLYNTLGKIFKTFDHKNLNSCMFYMNCWTICHLNTNAEKLTF